MMCVILSLYLVRSYSTVKEQYEKGQEVGGGVGGGFNLGWDRQGVRGWRRGRGGRLGRLD